MTDEQMFQSTHPLGVRLNIFLYIRKIKSFNPRTHSGCDLTLDHASVSKDSFNPRTHSGCDEWLDLKPTRVRCFNPRTHSGCDKQAGYPCMLYVPVSIHAPTRGATLYSYYLETKIEFQSTHPLGVRLNGAKVLVGIDEFQSTHPLGVRQDKDQNKGFCQGFYPRTHSGCD